jgi:hypothetical protein
MTFAPRRLLALLAVLLGAAAAPAAVLDPPGEPPPNAQAFAAGTHVFRRVLYNQGLKYDRGLKPVSGFAELHGLDARDCVVILLGDLTRLNQLPGGLTGFLNKGGAVLLASDQKVPDRDAAQAILDVTGVSLPGYLLVKAPQETCHRRRPDRPFVAPADRARPDLFRKTAENNWQWGVATNVPSFLEGVQLPSGMRVIGTLPADCHWEKPGGERGHIDDPLPFAVAGDVGKGRLLFLADHSVFVNGMMAPRDDNNVEFAAAAVDWLSDGGRRSRVLFVEDGTVNDTFNVQLSAPAAIQEPPIDPEDLLDLPEEDLVGMADATLARLEADDELNGTLWDWLRRHGHGPTWLVRLAVLAVSAGLLCVGGVMLVRRRHRVEAGLPTLARAAGQQTPEGPPLEERRRAMVKADNLYEAARGVARSAFAAAGLPEPPPGERRPRPRVVVRGGWWRRWRVRRRVEELWRLAYGKRPPRLRLSGWNRLLRDAEELRAGLADGTIRLEAA